MIYRLTTTFFISFLLVFYAPGNGICQSSDSILYLLSNDLVEDEAEKYDLLCILAASSVDSDSIIKYCEQAIRLAEKFDINPADAYGFKGFAYLNSGKLAPALDCFLKAADCYESVGDHEGLAGAYTYIAETYNIQDNYHNAMLYHKNAIEIFNKLKDTINLAHCLHNLAYINYSMEQYDSALVLYSETNALYLELGLLNEYAYSLGNTGLVYSRQADFQKAEDYLLNAISILSEVAGVGYEIPVMEFMIEYSSILEHQDKIEEAIQAARESFGMATQHHILEFERDAAYRLSSLFRISGMYDSAYYYQSIFINANDSIKSDENIQEMAELRADFEIARKQAEVDLLEKNKLIQIIVIIGLLVIILLAIGLIAMYSYNLKISKKLTAELDERNSLLELQGAELKIQHEELKDQKTEIETQHLLTIEQKNQIELHSKAITDSIKYAQKIQSAILPPESYLRELLHEYFIFNRPRNIVSGDFYWIKQTKGHIILVAADCTGHGVPGAFMSLLGISYLNEIVQRSKIIHADQILNELRSQVKRSLRQYGQQDQPKDGMDVAICIINIETKMMQYAGAFNPFYLIREVDGLPVLKEIKADSMPVGFFHGKDRSFTRHELQLEINDTFYIFSDGFADQFGGDDNKKFKIKNFKNLLLEIQGEDMLEQKEILDKTLVDWMNGQDQTDDVLVIGVRI